MASLTSVRLGVGRVLGNTEFAELTIRKNLTARERQENMSYLVTSFLVERDDGRDCFDMLFYGGIYKPSVGNLDDFIGIVGRQ
jgi:hypothetical protein